MQRRRESVSTFAQWASAAVIAGALGCGTASAQEVDFKNLPPEVQDAFVTIENYLSAKIAIADFTTVVSNEPGRSIVVNKKEAEETPGRKVKVKKKFDLMDVSTEMSVIISGSPGCQLRQVGGKYYWVPQGCAN